jgi:hypothetical protein
VRREADPVEDCPPLDHDGRGNRESKRWPSSLTMHSSNPCKLGRGGLSRQVIERASLMACAHTEGDSAVWPGMASRYRLTLLLPPTSRQGVHPPSV